MRPAIETFEGKEFDVVVIGAGINGASSAQHLSAAGYSVLLVDKGDLASGSSSRSTRMLHCGLRYFETPRPLLDFTLDPKRLADALRMAKGAMEIRGEIVLDSKDRLQPITLNFPIYRGDGYKPWQFDLAFRVLGRYGPKEVPLEYRRIGAEEARHQPLLNQLRDLDRLHSVATFREYMFEWPERFCIDAALDAERLGAVVRNYTEAELLKGGGGGGWRLRLTDTIGEARSAEVGAKVVLNMAGIWIDKVNTTGGHKSRRLVLGTKGAHLAVRLPPEWQGQGLATVNSIGEPHYCLPSLGGLHHIGPTETIYEGDLDDIKADDNEIDILLAETARALPGLKLSRDDIVYTWAGVRPLTYDPAYPKGKRSRVVHDLADQDLPRVLAMTAGPIMTHRSAGREMTEAVQRTISPSGPRRAPIYTPRRFPDMQNSPPLLDRDPSIKLADLRHCVIAEHARALPDILFARTALAWSHRLSTAELRKVADTVAGELGWSESETEAAVSAFEARWARLNGSGHRH